MPNNIYNNAGIIGQTIRATPVYVGGTTAAGAGTTGPGTVSLTSLVGGIDTAPKEGDIVVVAYSIGSITNIDVSVSIDQGTLIELVDLYSDDTVDTNLGVFYSIVGTTLPTSVTAGSTGSSANAGALAIHVWRNIDPENPIDVTTTTATATNSSLANPPSITTATENAVVLAIGASGNDNVEEEFRSGGDLSNFISIGGSDTEDATIGMGSIATTSPTTVDPIAFLITTNTNYSWAAATVALRPKNIVVLNNEKDNSLYSNGGIIGTQNYFNDNEDYLLSGSNTLSYVGGRIHAFDGTTSDTAFSITELSGGLASAPATDDIVIVAFATNPDTTNATLSYRISGYTEIADLYQLDTEQVELQVGYKIMGATPDTTVTITGGTGNTAQAGIVAIHVWRNVDTANPLDVTATTITEANTYVPNPPAITPVTQGAVIIAIGAGGHTLGISVNYRHNETELSNFIKTSANDGDDVSLGMGSFQWYEGEFNPSPFAVDAETTDSTSFASAAVTLALRPNGVFGNKKNSGIWSLQSAGRKGSSFDVEYLVIAGGGSGGSGNGGGGGAGGHRAGILTVNPQTNYTVTIGAGGARQPTDSSTGNNGSSSVFSTITSTGGGGGGGDTTGTTAGARGNNGGSGGGGRGYRTGAGGSGVAGQGHDGGTGSNTAGTVFGSGGGGGAGGVGESEFPGTSTKGGDGGPGAVSNITGTSIARAGGGGGGSEGSAISTVGTGSAGGGRGGNTSFWATNGSPGTGSGGGGGGFGVEIAGAAGGSGVVILKYPIDYTLSLSAGHSGYTFKNGTKYKVTVVTAGTGSVRWS